MQCGRLRPAVTYADLNQQVLRRLLGILDKHVKVAVFVEHARIEQFILHVAAIAPLARLHQVAVREFRLRILVQVLHIGVRGRAVQVEVVFLDVFAMVTLAVRQAEQSFLEDGVLAIPQRQAEAQLLLTIADAGEAIFAPVIGARAGLVMSEVVPGISVLAVVLTNRAPLPLAQVGPPLSPVLLAGAWLFV